MRFMTLREVPRRSCDAIKRLKFCGLNLNDNYLNI